MDIRFIRSTDRRDQTLVTRQDGVRLSVPVFGPLEPIPHDLAHYVVEMELGLRDGLWASIAAGAVLEGMKVLSGRQRPHAKERSRAIQIANHRGILLGELAVDVALRAIKGEPLDGEPYTIDYPSLSLRARKDHVALAQRVRPAIEAMIARWQAIPMGDALVVSWPDNQTVRVEIAKRRTHHERDGFTRARPS
jgi:hypothetical protein